MTREDLVAVRLKPSIRGAVTFTAGPRILKVEPGETVNAWLAYARDAQDQPIAGEYVTGAPITRGEFEAILAPEGLFELDESLSVESQAEAGGEA